MKSFTIYVASAMTGFTYQETKQRFLPIVNKLRSYGFTVLHPLLWEKEQKNNTKISAFCKKETKENNNHAITTRDRWMVMQSDIVFMDLSGTTQVSIGCMGELAWGRAYNKHTIVIMEAGNCHEHAFVFDNANVVFRHIEDALEYLEKFQTVWSHDELQNL